MAGADVDFFCIFQIRPSEGFKLSIQHHLDQVVTFLIFKKIFFIIFNLDQVETFLIFFSIFFIIFNLDQVETFLITIPNASGGKSSPGINIFNLSVFYQS